MRRRRLVRVPASSANLGPGFDAFACAIAMHMQLEVEETGSFGVHTDLKIARDHRNLAVRGFARLADPERFTFRIRSQIPLSGGFVVCADGQATRFDPPTGLEAVVVVPDAAVRTKAARAALPPEVPMADAVFNTAHGALLVLGLARGDWDLVARGLADRLHQPRREHLYPRSMELVG